MTKCPNCKHELKQLEGNHKFAVQLNDEEFCLSKRKYEGKDNPNYRGINTPMMSEHEKYLRYKETHKKARVRNKGKYNCAKAVKKYANNNKEKIKAKDKSKYVEIPKGYICDKCKTNLATQRHHEDYSKPLEVIFVCRDCHAELDRLRRKRENER